MNQWIDSYLLKQLAVSTATVQVLQAPSDIVETDLDLSSLVSRQNDKEEPLLCLGSRYPAHPEQVASFGLLPKQLWGRLANLGDLATTFILDQLLGMNHFRHILFTRDRPNEPYLFRAYFVANENIFSGSQRRFENWLDLNSYCGWHAYSTIAPAQWLQALELVGSHPLADCQAALAGFPEPWIEAGERGEMERLFSQLQARQQTLSEWIQIPSRCLHFPTRQALQSALKPIAPVALSPTLSPA